MSFTLLTTQSVAVIGTPVTAAGGPSLATLSAATYASSDPTVFTVASDPNVPNGAIITAVGSGTATLTETATATEPDGVTKDNIQGSTSITVGIVAPPPPVATSIGFTFGAPFNTPPLPPAA